MNYLTHDEMISWDDLNRCTTADEIADLLQRNGVRGIPQNKSQCPLARVTGWRIGAHNAYTDHEIRPLTPAQQEFVELFDDYEYPDLLDEDTLVSGEECDYELNAR
jgi:hypothetical protein